MLHTCRSCGEAWDGSYVAAHDELFDVEREGCEVLACPNCHHGTYDIHVNGRRVCSVARVGPSVEDARQLAEAIAQAYVRYTPNTQLHTYALRMQWEVIE